MNVLRFQLFPDAKIWANVGVGDRSTDDISQTLKDMDNLVTQTVNFQKLNLEEYEYEIYVVERPLFNQATLFIDIILQHKQHKRVFEYIRPSGPYWEGLQEHYKDKDYLNNITKEETYNPKVILEGGQEQTVYSLPLYGHHHPNRIKFNLTGGACPSRGGDRSDYPWGNSGAGWPNNYEEITPLCDGFLIDVKLWSNLDVKSWTNISLGLGNAALPNAGWVVDKHQINFRVEANVFGKFTDPYLLDNHKENPHQLILTKDGQEVPIETEKLTLETVVIPILFIREPLFLDFIAVPEAPVYLKNTRSLTDYCPAECPCKQKSPCKQTLLPSHQCTINEPVEAPCAVKTVRPITDEKPITEVSKPVTPGNGEALKMTYEIAKKLIGLALVLV